VRNAIMAMLATALFIGACLLCSAGANSGIQHLVTAGYIFGFAGFALMIFVFVAVRKD
jgi:hypothetical protein